MRDILQYFDLIAGAAEGSGAESAELDFAPAGRTSGTVIGVFYFYDGSRLEFTERVAIEERHPVKVYYRYQYVRTGEPAFRYDNAHHHPGLSNYPHHKHVGEKIVSAIEPTLSQILDEVSDCLREARRFLPNDGGSASLGDECFSAVLECRAKGAKKWPKSRSDTRNIRLKTASACCVN